MAKTTILASRYSTKHPESNNRVPKHSPSQSHQRYRSRSVSRSYRAPLAGRDMGPPLFSAVSWLIIDQKVAKFVALANLLVATANVSNRC